MAVITSIIKSLKGKDKIADEYSKRIEDHLDNQSDPDFFKSLDHEELDQIWEEISYEMDISEVWNKVSSDLDVVMPADSGSGIIFKSVVVILIFLIGMIPVKKVQLDSLDSAGILPEIKIENKLNEQSESEIIKGNDRDNKKSEQYKENVSPVLISSFNKSYERADPIFTKRNITDFKYAKPISAGTEGISNLLVVQKIADPGLIVSANKVPDETTVIPSVFIPDHLGKVFVSYPTVPDSLKKNKNSSAEGLSGLLFDERRFSVGMITLFKNTWLLNQETFDGLKSESDNTTNIVFYPDAGVSLGYSLSKTWSIQVDGLFSSKTGQEYHEYLYGHYSFKKITLRYSTIVFSAKYKFTDRKLINIRSSINILAGAYLSVLNHADKKTVYTDQKLISDVENILSQYEKYDLGVKLGSELELHLSDNFSLAPGFSLSLGIPNIYKGTNIIPGYLKLTRNGSAEFHLAFYLHYD